MEINVNDYLSEDEMKEICQEGIKICRFHNGKESFCNLFKRHLEHSYNEDKAYPDSFRLPECIAACKAQNEKEEDKNKL